MIVFVVDQFTLISFDTKSKIISEIDLEIQYIFGDCYVWFYDYDDAVLFQIDYELERL